MDVITSRKIRSGLSFSGWIYVLLSLVIGLAAVNSNNNVLFLITSLLLSLLFLSGLTALYNISGLKIRPGGGSILTAGHPGPVMLKVENNKKFASLVLDISLGSDSAMIPVVSGGKDKDIFLNWTPPCRGRPQLPGIRLTSSFPFGFVRRGGLFDAGPGPIVAPKPVGSIEEFLSAEHAEQSLSVDEGQGRGDWKGIRQYRPGEGKASIIWRRLDWQKPAMGRDSAQWPAHSFAPEHSKSFLLDWDDPVYAHLDTEKRLSVIRSALDMVVQDNQAWKLRLPNKKVSGRAGFNYEQALMALALVEPLPGASAHNSFSGSRD